MKRSFVVAAALLALAVPIAAQTGQGGRAGGPPQPQGPPPKATAVVTGQVIDGSSSQPVSEAIVTLAPGAGARGGGMPTGASPEIQQALQAAMAAAGGGRGSNQRRVMTAADGRFVFHSLPPGQYTLTVSASGYTSSLSVSVTPSIPGIMGGVAPSASPTTFALKEGEFATNFRLRLWKYAVVGGSVLDDAGEPAVGLTVQVARRLMASGRARFVPANSAKTDDRGMFRITSVTPGDYVIVVPQTQLSMPASILSSMMEGMSSGSLGLASMAMTMLDVMGSGINPQDAMTGGVRLGDYMVSASGAVPLLSPDGRLLAFQTQFHPGVAAPAQATVLNLRSGEEKTDISFQLRLIPTSYISGVAMGPEGPVGSLGVRLVVPGDGSVSDSEFDVATAITKPDGTFSFFGVPPGQFLLKAEKQPRPAIAAEAMAANPMAASMFPGGMPAGAKEMLFVAQMISVAANIDNLTLQLRPGYRVSGRVEFASVTGRQAPTRLNSAVQLLPMDGRMPNILGLMAEPDLVNAQGEFKTKGLPPGRYFLSISFPGWQMKSATIGGRDVLDAPVEIRDGDVSDVVVTFTDKVAQITGKVRSAEETDLSETAVLVFPLDYRMWASNGMNPRRGLTARAARDGSYTLSNVPAGDYFIVAVDRATQGELQDPRYVEALSRVATRISVATDNVTQDLNKTRVQR